MAGFDFLRDRQKLADQIHSSDDANSELVTFAMELPKHGTSAEAREIDGEFVWLAVRPVGNGSVTASHASYRPLYEQLTVDGVLVPDASGVIRFSQDQLFSSPSAAAAVVSGHSANGRIVWFEKKSRMSYGDWQSERLEQATV